MAVRLTGLVISRTYPGPPEYESIRKGDEPETYWLLALSKPVCVNEDKPNFNPAYANIHKIQLVFPDEKAYKKYRKLLGKRVVATGTLYAGFNVHHKTRVLLIVKTLERPPAKNVTWHLNFSDSRRRSPLTLRQFSHIHTEGAENARKAAAYIAEHGPTNNATAYIITNGEEPTPVQVRRLGDVHFVQRVGDVFLYQPGGAPYRHSRSSK